MSVNSRMGKNVSVCSHSGVLHSRAEGSLLVHAATCMVLTHATQKQPDSVQMKSQIVAE